MGTRLFALLGGIFLLVGGILGFMPATVWDPPTPMPLSGWMWVHPGALLGFIPVNWPHNILWILLGAAGVLSSVSYALAIKYSQGLALLTTGLAMIGLLPLGIGEIWGLLPLSTWNVGIHFVFAVLAWYFGFVYPYSRAWGIARQGV